MNKKNKRKWEPIVDNFKYDKIIAKHAEKYGVDPDLVKSFISIKSSFNPDKTGANNCKGLMQLSESAVKTIWGKTSAKTKWKKIFDPETNIETGVKYLKKWLTHHKGNVNKAFADYNMGHSAFTKWMKEHNNDLNHNIASLPKETKDLLNRYNREAKAAYEKQKSCAFGECKWVTILGIHVCLRFVAPSSK